MNERSAARPEPIPEKITVFEKVLATSCVVALAGYAIMVKLKKPGVGKGLN